VADLALELGRIESPTGREGQVAGFLVELLAENGLSPRLVALLPEHPNVLAALPGAGGGPSLAFNSHIDTVVWRDHPALAEPGRDIYHTAWREDGVLYGHGLMNDKGPLAAWLVAVLALRESGVRLRGDVILTMVSGEVGHEPVDEFQGPAYSGKDLGARYLATHGGVADYVLVAENTDFRLGWVEAGKLFCKLRLIGEPFRYTPFVPLRGARTAVAEAGTFLAAWEDWSADYTERHRSELPGGVVAPRASIGAIRAGLPYAVTHTPEVCDVYLDLRLAPGQSPTDTLREVRELAAGLDIEAEVDAYLYRPGHEAVGVEPLAGAVRAAHRRVFGDEPGIPSEPITSMWRDVNVWNEIGIPAAMYGPAAIFTESTYGITVDDLHKVALVYAATALELCG
jgi:acetylornithine deacetylase/succinyl-diaminopimelate desuccinylase-like protein